MLHIGIVLIIVSIGLGCIAMMIDELHKRMDLFLIALSGINIRPYPSTDNTLEASAEFVTCGGCGRVVELRDGFNPVEHDCDGIDHGVLAR